MGVKATRSHALTHMGATTHQGAAAPHSVYTASLASAYLQGIGWQAAQVVISLWTVGNNVWLGTHSTWWCSLPRRQINLLLRAASHQEHRQAAGKPAAALKMLAELRRSHCQQWYAIAVCLRLQKAQKEIALLRVCLAHAETEVQLASGILATLRCLVPAKGDQPHRILCGCPKAAGPGACTTVLVPDSHGHAGMPHAHQRP